MNCLEKGLLWLRPLAAAMRLAIPVKRLACRIQTEVLSR
jgi:hypothetical protein